MATATWTVTAPTATAPAVPAVSGDGISAVEAEAKQGASLWAEDLVELVFTRNIKMDAVARDASTYQLELRSSEGRSVEVRRVLLPIDVTVSDRVYLVVSRPTAGAVYRVHVLQSLRTPAGETHTTPASDVIARPTKIDSIVNSRPRFYSRRPEGVHRSLLNAIGRQDDLIGGSFQEIDPIGLRGRRTLMDLLPAAPTAQTFGESAQEVAADMGGVDAPQHVWPMQEPDGAGVAHDVVGGVDLSPHNGAKNGRVAYGISDGVSISSRRCIETYRGSSQRFIASSGSSLDFDDVTSFAFRITFRAGPGTSGTLIQKFVGGVGYRLLFASGSLRLTLDDGTNTAFGTTTETFTDSSWHDAVCIVDRNTQTGYVITKYETVSFDISSINSLSNGQALRFGAGAANNTTFQVTFAAAWDGSSAESLVGASVATWWKHGTDPTGLLKSYARSSTHWDIVADVAGEGLRAMSFAKDEVALGWHQSFSEGLGLGLRHNSETENLQNEAVQLENWTASSGNISVSAAFADLTDSPLLMFDMRKVTATVADEYVQETITVPSATEVSTSIVVQRATAAVETVELEHFDATNATVIGTQQVTLDHDRRVRIDLTVTTGGTEVSAEIRLRIATSGGGSVWAWASTTKEGKPGVLVPTQGGGAIAGAPSMTINNDALQNLKPVRGEIEVTFVADVQTTGVERSLLGVDGEGGGTANDVDLRITAGGAARFTIRDNDDSVAQDVSASGVTVTEGHVVRARWDSTGEDVDGNPETADVVYDGARTAGADAAWPAGRTDELRPGADPAGAEPLDGLIHRIRVFDDWREQEV